MKPLAIVFGASRGIGRACAQRMREDWDVVTVARTGEVTHHGDIQDESFLRSLAEKYTPNAVINCAGFIGEEAQGSFSPNSSLSSDMKQTYGTNLIGPALLTLLFYEKMERGHIVHVTSESANKVGWEGMAMARVLYQASKTALKKFITTLEESRQKPVKMTSLEPGWVNTNFAGEDIIDVPDSEGKRQTQSLIPMDPHYVAGVIKWILEQPDNVVVQSLCLRNLKITKQK